MPAQQHQHAIIEASSTGFRTGFQSSSVLSAEAEGKEQTTMSMELLFSKIKQLPVIPKLLHELMQSFSDDNSRIEDIAKKMALFPLRVVQNFDPS